jgi:hypothetical protein
VKRERRRLPRIQRSQGGVQVDEIALDPPRLVGDPVGVGVEAAARDPEESAIVELADVDGPDMSRRDHIDRPGNLAGDPEHPGEVVAPTAGQDSQRYVPARQNSTDLADQPVAAHHNRGLTRIRGGEGLRAPVLEPLREHEPVRKAPDPKRTLDLG